MSPRRPPEGSTSERFARRARQVRSSRRRPVLLALLAVVLVVLVVYLVAFSPVLAVRSVQVDGAPDDAAREQVRQVAAVRTGVPLARADLDGPGRRVAALPLYSSVEVARKWPSTILVTVTPRTAVLALHRANDYQLVDSQGVAYQTVATAPKGVPTATGAGAGEVAPQGLRAAISVMDALPESLRGRVASMQVKSASMVTFQVDRTTVRWGDESEPQLKAKVLQALLGSHPGTIDVSAPHTPATR